ncbi:MAG TPA: class I SAM-dependent methyltransferase [Bryobacteraceae bacterium]|jgi:SAM-dependent methyltransferase
MQNSFFTGVALEFWRRAMSPEQTRLDADFLVETLQCPSGGQLLDVPCGNGRHAIELAKRGYVLTGVDGSEEYIEEARASMLPVEWRLADMRELPWAARFDGAYCCGNSFAVLDAGGARQFLKAVASAVKPGGRFVLDTGMAAESILPSLGKGRWHRLGDMIVLSENRYHPAESRLEIEYTFIQQGKVETRSISTYCFTAAEICRMHAEAGLQVLDLLDWYKHEPYQLGSRGLVVVSQAQR